MMRSVDPRSAWGLALAGAASLALGGVAIAAESVPRPNVVFLLLDNFGQEWWGCYGSEEGCTPNLERLAREGVRVENCHAPPDAPPPFELRSLSAFGLRSKARSASPGETAAW